MPQMKTGLDAVFNCYEKLYTKSMGNYITNFNKYVIKSIESRAHAIL